MPDLWDRPDLVKSWKQKQKKKRRELAEQSLDIQVSNDIDGHNANTLRRAQALSRRQRRDSDGPFDITNGMWNWKETSRIVKMILKPIACRAIFEQALSARMDLTQRLLPLSPHLAQVYPVREGACRRHQAPLNLPPLSPIAPRLCLLEAVKKRYQQLRPALNHDLYVPFRLRAKLRSPAKDPPSR